jgi:hypothetical protein
MRRERLDGYVRRHRSLSSGSTERRVPAPRPKCRAYPEWESRVEAMNSRLSEGQRLRETFAGI